ncbi:hypothetical protein Ancab_030255 [Ancistrocladus abbreviatus]
MESCLLSPIVSFYHMYHVMMCSTISSLTNSLTIGMINVLLQERKLAPPELPKFEDPVLAAPPPEKKEDPFLNIAPKKPNWDLRRDVQKKLDKLERRTHKALFKLMETWIHVNSEIREPKHSVWSTFWSGSGPNSDMK